MLTIFVDGDACPVKDEAVRVATRYSLQVYIVSNTGLRRALGPNVKSILVDDTFDAADHWIAEHVGGGDIVLTADIQLAARCLKKAAAVLNFNGQGFTADNIGSALAMRELNSQLREMGEKTYNPSFSKNDRSQFLQSLDLLIQKSLREK